MPCFVLRDDHNAWIPLFLFDRWLNITIIVANVVKFSNSNNMINAWQYEHKTGRWRKKHNDEIKFRVYGKVLVPGQISFNVMFISFHSFFWVHCLKLNTKNFPLLSAEAINKRIFTAHKIHNFINYGYMANESYWKCWIDTSTYTQNTKYDSSIRRIFNAHIRASNVVSVMCIWTLWHVEMNGGGERNVSPNKR